MYFILDLEFHLFETDWYRKLKTTHLWKVTNL